MAKPFSEMSREEVRDELDRLGLLKSTEWFNNRIVPMLLEDKRLRETLAAKEAELAEAVQQAVEKERERWYPIVDAYDAVRAAVADMKNQPGNTTSQVCLRWRELEVALSTLAAVREAQQKAGKEQE